MAGLGSAVPKVGAIPKIAKKKAAAAPSGGADLGGQQREEFLRWNGGDVSCTCCHDAILVVRAGEGGVVDSQILCGVCLPTAAWDARVISII